MSAPDSLIADLMVRVRREFYSERPAKHWYQQQDTVKKALTFPASWLEERKVPMSARRYREIINLILNTIISHAKTQQIAYPSAYILHCVQQHMAHHGDAYYQEGKSCRNRIALQMAVVERTAAARSRQSGADVIPAFAQVHAALAIGKSKGRPKASKPAPQPDLFRS